MATNSYRTQCEEDLLETARQYARLKLHCAYVEDNNVVFCNATDAETKAGYLSRTMLKQAEKLILGMSIDEIDKKLQP